MLAGKNAALLDAVDTHQKLTDDHLQLLEARLEGMAAELAAQLADGIRLPGLRFHRPTPPRPRPPAASCPTRTSPRPPRGGTRPRPRGPS